MAALERINPMKILPILLKTKKFLNLMSCRCEMGRGSALVLSAVELDRPGCTRCHGA